VSVFEAPELTGPVRISADGNIDLPLIGRAAAAGLTPVSLSASIRNKLISGSFLKDPQVNIFLAESATRTTTVIGEVVRPGPIPLLGLRTLWDVVGASGGVTSGAGSLVTVQRAANPIEPEQLSVEWDRPITGQPNPLIHPGDTVQVSRAGVVYILGQVEREGGYPIVREHLTIAQAIALANGVKYQAKAKHARLIRRTVVGHSVQEINVAAIIHGDAPDVDLQDNDILFLPYSLARVALSRGIEAAIGITSQVSIYRAQK